MKVTQQVSYISKTKSKTITDRSYLGTPECVINATSLAKEAAQWAFIIWRLTMRVFEMRRYNMYDKHELPDPL